jgi:hypothetical protein
MTTPQPTPVRSLRIRRDGNEIREVLAFVGQGITDSNRRAIASLVAQGFDELEVTRAVLDWWTTEGPAHLGEFVEQVVTAIAEADAPDQEAKN